MPESLASAPPSAGALFDKARVEEAKLESSRKLRVNPRAWWDVARRYRSVVLADPKSGYCDDALFREAALYREIDRRFTDRKAVKRSLAAYQLLIQGYPGSKWVAASRYARSDLLLNRLSDGDAGKRELKLLVDLKPKSDEAKKARKILSDWERPKEVTSLVAVRNIRHWVGRDYTRLVIDMDREVPFIQDRLKEPDRIYFDFHGTTLSKSLETQVFPVNDAFLKQIRVAQNQPDVVRVVLDFQNISRYNVFSLADPYRLVVDILGERPEDVSPSETPVPVATAAAASPAPIAEEGGATPVAAAVTPLRSETAPSPAARETAAVRPAPLTPEPTSDGHFPLTRQLGLAARRVVVDAGHGGHDPGASGRGGTHEKEVVLDVALKLKLQLETAGYEVILTRDDDTFIPLEERTAIANSKDADLFVSIHANASRNRRVRGVETFYLNLATTPEAEETAARENAISSRGLSELQGLLKQIMNNSKIAESRDFAGRIQRALADTLVVAGTTKDLGVKTAPFYVLLGANMPSVLVEISFISHPDEEHLLTTDTYRAEIARAIFDGIQGYTSSLKPALASSLKAPAGRPHDVVLRGRR